MIPCTAYMEVPLWKNLDFPRSLNSPCFNANPMPIKKPEPKLLTVFENEQHIRISYRYSGHF